MFRNFQKPNWFLGFRANGKPKRGDRTAIGQKEVVLLKISLEQKPQAKTGGIWLDLEQRIREAFIKGTITRSTNNNLLSSPQQTVELVNGASSTTPRFHNVMSDAPTRRDFQTEIEMRRNITSYLTDGTDITLPPQGSTASASVWSSQGAKKRRRNRKRNKKNHKNRTTKPTASSHNFDITASLGELGASDTGSVSHNVASIGRYMFGGTRTEDPPTIPSVLKIRRTTPLKRSRRKRTKNAKKRSRSRKNKSGKKSSKT